jgi:hypothetical protein
VVEQTIALLNGVRAVASAEYAARIPAATRDNITAVGNAILDYEPTKNEFTTVLIDKIGMTIVNNKLAQNYLAKFKKGSLPFGSTAEEIWVEIAKAEGAFDPTGANPLGRRLSDVKVYYHSENRQDKYVKSITDAQLHKAFLSQDGLDALTGGILNAIYSGADQDEYILMKRLLADYKDNYCDYGVTAVTDEDTARALLRSIRKASLDMSFMSTNYNKAGVTTRTPVEEQALIIHKDVLAHIDVDVIAKTFNVGKTDIQVDITPVDDFDTLTDTYALLIDKDFFMVYDTLRQSAQAYNADGLFTNQFLHIHQILSLSPFKNAVRFTTTDPLPVPPG